MYINNIRTRQASDPLSSHPGAEIVALSPFAADPASAIRQVGVRIARPQPASLLLEYVLEGDPAGIRLASGEDEGGGAGEGGPRDQPVDGLWRHTCMEVFVSGAEPGAYLEFNLAPDGRWAAYRFSGYRSGMAPLSGISPPRIDRVASSAALLLRASVALPADLADARLRLGLAAVIETAGGQLSYWALRHCADRPDFHHPDSFGFGI
jgi:hypothetical protein